MDGFIAEGRITANCNMSVMTESKHMTPPPHLPKLKKEKKDKIKSDKSTMSKLAFLSSQANRRFRF